MTMSLSLRPGMLDPPVLVWTVGKVASSSVYATLRHYGFDAMHVHYLGDWQLSHQVNRVYRGQALPANIVTSLRFRHAFDRGLFKGPFRIVTLVRDPLARNISAYFENLGYFGKGGVGNDVDAHVANFLKVYPHEIALDWLDYEIREVTGIDYRGIGFDLDKGWKIHRGRDYEALILCSEKPDAAKLEALSEFLATPMTALKRENDAASKAYWELYAAFRERVTLPRALVDYMYDNEFCATFWSGPDIARMKSAWRVAELDVALPVMRKRKPPLLPYSGPRASPAAIVDVQSKWALSRRGFDREASLRIAFTAMRGVAVPRMRVSVYAEPGVRVATFEPGTTEEGPMAAGLHQVALDIADLPLANGEYACALEVRDADELVHTEALAPLVVARAGNDRTGDLVAAVHKWTRSQARRPAP